MAFKRKILIGYGVIFILLGLVVAWAVVNLISLGKASDAILNENYRSIIAAENMVDALERQDSGILLIALGDIDNGIAQFRANEEVFLEWLTRAKDNITIEGEDELVKSIDSNYTAYLHQFSVLTDSCKTANPPIQLPVYYETVCPLFMKIRDGCINLRKLNEETMYNASLRAGEVSYHAFWSTIIVSAFALIVALIFSLFLAERIVKPIRYFMEAVRKISSGDYSVHVPVETGDELGLLADEFNQMTTQLSSYNDLNIEQIIVEKNKGEAILSSIEDGLVVFDTKLNVTGINPAARRILGLDFSETFTLRCMDILPDSNICDLIRKTVETGIKPVIPDDQRFISIPDGEKSRYYMYSIATIRGKDRNLSGIVFLLRDVTRLKEVEQLKSEFVMVASHELRTPLTSLGMSIDLLLERTAKDVPKRDHDLLQVAHEEIQRMKALVSDLLDLSRIESGKIDMEFEKIQVQILFDQAETVFKGQLDAREVALTSDVQKDLPKVRADANKITWVLTNLISNALRYVGKDGHIQLTAHRIGPLVHISVSDDGPGIPLEYQSRIFQKFVQVKGLETGGSGLGLAICREIVRAHGGAIWVESSPGKGSTFTFTLPLAQ